MYVKLRNVIASAIFVVYWQTGYALPIASFDSSGNFSLSQVIDTVSGTTTFGFNLDSSTLTGQYGYLNLVNGSSWLVQNVPLYLPAEAADQRNFVWFHDFGGVVGTTAPISISGIINDQPYSSQPTPDSTWTSATLTPDSFVWTPPNYAGEAGSGSAPSAPTAPPPPPDAAKVEGFLRGGVKDIRQYWNECGPTSTTNSLLWLAAKYGFEGKLPQKPDGTVDQEKLILELARVMKPGWSPSAVKQTEGYDDRGYPGLDRGELEAGKKKYIKDKGLPIEVHGGVDDLKAQGADTFDWVKKELKRGQDVEFLIDKGDVMHWVTVVGFIDAGARNMLVVHDPLLANGNHYWEIDDVGKLSSPVGTANRAVAESIPEPGTLILLFSGIFALVFITRARREPVPNCQTAKH